MKLHSRLALLALATALTSCAILKKEELAEIRSKRVSEPLMTKLEHKEALLSSDVIELKRRGVSNEITVHYIRRTGIAAPIHEADLISLRGAGVPTTTINLLQNESDKLIADRRALGQPIVEPAPIPPEPIIPPPPVPPQP